MFFITNKDGKHNNLYPKDKILNEDGYFQKIQSVVMDNPPKRSITISFQRGKALMYVNPLVTGGEKEEDLEYLLMICKRIKNVVKYMSNESHEANHQ